MVESPEPKNNRYYQTMQTVPSPEEAEMNFDREKLLEAQNVEDLE